MPGIVVNALNILAYLILIVTLCDKCYYCSHFADEETETQKEELTCPRSHILNQDGQLEPIGLIGLWSLNAHSLHPCAYAQSQGVSRGEFRGRLGPGSPGKMTNWCHCAAGTCPCFILLCCWGLSREELCPSLPTLLKENQ